MSGAAAGRAALGPASLVLYDVTTLYFETDQGDGFRESGFSKERRLEPQITLGLLTDAAGFPLQLTAFEGNKAETQTMFPVIETFKTAHGLADVTVVADAGMISAGNQQALEASKQFRRVNGHLHLPALRTALERHFGAETVGTDCNTQTVSAA